jgi:hypothetical protein
MMFYESLQSFAASRICNQEGRSTPMSWELLMNEQDRVPMWIRQIGEVHLTVYRSSDARQPWKWVVEYGIASTVGYARTVRAAKMRATRIARQYAIQGELWRF